MRTELSSSRAGLCAVLLLLAGVVSAATAGWPDATNTGYKNAPGYPGSLRPFTGTIESGKTYSFYDFRGGFSVPWTVHDVTFFGCRFAASTGAAADNANVVVGNHYETSGDNIVFDYCTFCPEVVSQPPTSYLQGYGYGIDQRGVMRMTVDHCDFWGFGGGMQLAGSNRDHPVVVRNSWMHDARADGGGVDHTDGILDNWGNSSYLTIDHNTIVSQGNTQGIALQGANGYSNLTITNNYVSGFGYTVCLGGPNGTNTNVVFTGNVFATDIRPYWGPLYPMPSKGTGNVWRNNKLHVVPGSYYTPASDDGKFWLPDGFSWTDYQGAETPDGQAPTVPTGLTATAVSATQINLTWTASTDNVGVTGYRVYRNGTQAGISSGTSYSATGLSSSTAYSFTVAASDAAGNLSAPSTAKSATTQANHAPVATAQSVSVNQNIATAITLAATDADAGDTRTYAIVTRPSHGTLGSIAGAQVTYTPASGYLGADSFTFKATDNHGAASATATVSITVAVPSATENLWGTLTAASVTTDGTAYELGTIFTPTVAGQVRGIRVYAAQGESGAHTARIWNNTANTVVGGPYTLTFGGPGWYTYTLPTAVSLTANTAYTVSVSTGADASHAYAVVANALAASGTNGAHLHYPANAGVFTTTLGSRPTSIYQASNYLRDIVFAAATATNRAPVAAAQSVSTARNTAKAITLGASDADGNTLSYAIVANPAHGTLTGSGANRTYTPTTGYSGADSFTFRANDGTVNSNTATVSITVTATANAAPVVSTATATPSPVTGLTTAVTATATDDAGEAALVYTWSATGPAAVSFSPNGTHAATASTATFSKVGSYTLQVTAKDAGNLTGARTVAVTVNATATSVTLSPTSASVRPGETVDFNATVRDQFGVALATQPAMAWTVSGGGTISGSGLFTAGTAAASPSGGTTSVTYVATATSGGRSGTALVTVSDASTGAAATVPGGCGSGGAAGLLICLSALVGLRQRRTWNGG